MVYFGFVGEEDNSEEFDIKEILENKDLMTMMIDELREVAPGAGSVLVDERDEFLAHKILQNSDSGSITVIGAGHLTGVKSHLNELKKPNNNRIKTLSEIPKNNIPKVLPWLIPLILFGFVIKSGLENDIGEFTEILTTWALANSICAAIAVILARGHIFSVITAAIASP